MSTSGDHPRGSPAISEVTMLEYADDRPWPGATGWSDVASRRALDVIADAVEHLTGYEVSCINVVHRGVLRAVAVHGPEEGRDALMDSQMPVAALEAELASGQVLGRFVFTAAGSFPDNDGYGVVFHDAGTVGSDDAWDVSDSLMAPIRDEDGHLIAALCVDVPTDRRRADAARVERLDRYAELVEVAVRMALEHDEQLERIAMARAARGVVTAATRELSMDAVFTASASALVSGFSARGVWLCAFSTPHSYGPRNEESGQVHPVPDVVMRASEHLARTLWDQRSVLALSTERPLEDMPASIAPEDAAIILRYLTGIDVGSILFAPIGVGTECLGCLVLSRHRRAQGWTTVESEAARDIGVDLGRSILNTRAYEREQRAVRELQALNVYKSNLFTTLSHELKTPLASILGNLELLDSDELSDSDSRRGLSALSRGATRMVRVVDDLMLLAKVGDPANVLIPRPVDLVDLVLDVVDLISTTAHQQGVAVEVVGTRGPVVALGDAAELDRVITNIVSNAVKYTRPGGRVELHVGHEADAAVVTCRDTGIGIGADDVRRLFHEFFRSSDPAAQAQPGTGLGLAIVDRIMQRHGGRVDVESELGTGSAFRIVLPGGPVAVDATLPRRVLAHG